MTDESSHLSENKKRNQKEMNNQVCNEIMSNYASTRLTIQGSFHQGADIFGTNSGKQCVANCLLAVVKSKLRHIEQWDQAYLDSVLIEGNELYTFIHGNNDELLVTELPQMIEVSEMLVKCERKDSFGSVINATCNIDFSMIPNALPLDQALQESLIDTDGCFICVQGFTSIAIRHNTKLYLFDSHARNSLGFPDINGRSLLTELQDVYHLYELLCNFVRHNESAQFEITGITVNIIGSSLHNFSIPQLEQAPERIESPSDSLQSLPDIEVTHSPITNCCYEDSDISSDVEIISDTRVCSYDFDFITKDQRKNLCSVLNVPSKFVNNGVKYLSVSCMGPPSETKIINGDGNCLFRAISFAVSQRQQYYQKVRSAIVKHSLLNSDKLASFLDSESVVDYITRTKMEEENVWGTAFEILVAADLLKTDIYTYFEGKWLKYSSKMICIENEVNKQAIYLKNVNNHYEVVTNVTPLCRSFNKETGDFKRKNKSRERCDFKSLKKMKNESESNQNLSSNSHVKRKCCDFDVDTELLQCNTQSSIKKTKSEKEKEKYHNDPEYRAKKISKVSARYHNNKDYRREKIDSNRTKYWENEEHRELKKDADRERYDSNEIYKQNKITSIKNKYATDESYKQNIKDASKREYDLNEFHRENKKESSKHKYAIDVLHRENVKDYSKHKYAIDEMHKQKVKVSSKTRYATDERHRQNVKLASIEKYKCDIEHQQTVKNKVKDKREKEKAENTQIHKVIEKFKTEVKKGPEYVCACCFRLFFNSQVKACKKDEYTNKDEEVKYASIVSISEKYLHKCNTECETGCKYSDSSRSNLWICFTCHRKIMKGKIPAECHANNLELEEVPKELSVLNSLEQHLVALNIPFMKVMGLPKGGQKGVHGPVVCVPSDHNKVTTCLPRCDNDNQMLRVKLKRKLCYKGYEEYQFVCPKRLEEAFMRLKEQNIWFSDINYSNTWLNPIPETPVDIGNIENQNDCTEDQNVVKNKVSEDNCQTECEDESYLDDGLRGLQLDTSLQPDDIGQEVLDTCFDHVFNVSPAEGNSPVSILKEDGIEAKSFPVHYPSGRNTYTEERDEKLSLLRYFNLRLTSVENRFARDTSYIFFSQYLSELDRIISNVQISLRKESAFNSDGKTITSTTLCNKDSLKNLFKKDEAIKYLKPVRGTPPYWQSTQKDIFAMIRQLGIPTFFCSFSSADFRWPEMIQTIMKQQGDTRCLDDLDWNEKCKILRSNPVTMARMFDHRFHTFLYDVILSDANPIGKVIDYFYRVEFQQRGSPHTHCLFWIEDAPKLDVDDDNDVVEFIDKYITCEIPDLEDDPELHEIVKTVHQHSKKHSKSCKKKGTICRFNFPRPPSTKTFISRKNEIEASDEETNTEETSRKEKLAELWKCILDKENEGKSTEDLFKEVGITQAEFEKCYNAVTNRNSVVLKRNLSEIYTNQYNKDLLRAWNANMDIQPVLDAYSCIVYMISYISKAERELGLLLQQTKVEAQEGNLDAQHTMKKIGTAYMHHREISAQEAVYRVVGLKLKECSRNVQFIPVGENPCRMSLPLKLLANQENKKKKGKKDNSDDEDDDNSIWMKNIVDRYKERPLMESFEMMCLATFCSEYNVLSESQVPQKINEETTFQLGKDMGYIRKRTRTSPAVIRYPRFSVEATPEKFYQSILQLFLPYRHDMQLKPTLFETYESFYKTGFIKIGTCSDLIAIRSIVDKNRNLFVKDEHILDEAERDLEERGLQEDAWGCLFTESEVERHESIDEGSVSTVIEQEKTDMTIPDLNKVDKSHCTNLSSMLYQTNEILPLLRSLNIKQINIFYKIREWCLKKVSGEIVEPFHVFITGGGGTGKSHLIKCLYYESTRIFARGIDNPDDITVLLTAPTGTAAFNINGLTIHSALSIFKTLSADHALLSEDRINTLRSKLENLHILIIDEVSMVNKRLLFFIHERLRQIKKTSEKCLYGGVSIIAVGDFYQLPPVKTKKCDKLYVNDLSNPIDYLWNGLFELVELDEIMRQREDSCFAEILNRLRVKQKNETVEQKDLEALQKCMTEGPDDALHIFATNEEVRNYNTSMIMKTPSESKLIEAEDYLKVKTTGKLIKKKVNFPQSEILLPTSLLLAEGARVMLIKNIDISDGLVNGVMGTVISIHQSLPCTLPEIIYIQFDNIKVGRNAEFKKCINGKNCVGLKPCIEDVPKQNGSRKQFPLQLSWACTVHKVQGLTVNECVVALNKCFSYGQAYVALSRVTSLNGLHITEIDDKQLNNKIYCDPDVTDGLLAMKKFLPNLPIKKTDTNTVTLMYHNIQGLENHITDLQANLDFKDVDCICLTETWLTEKKHIQLDGYKFEHISRNEAYDSSDELYRNLKQMQHGGVGVYFKNSDIFEKIHVTFSNLECVVIKISSLNVLFATLYRTKQYQMQKFQENLAVLLQNLSLLSDKLIIVGDFNQDLLKEDSLKKFMTSKGFQQLVQSPTTEGRTLIDHVYVHGCNDVTVLVIPTYYSYHDAVSIKLSSDK